MTDTPKIPPRIISLISGVLIVSGFILNWWWKESGPEWAHWLGSTFYGFLLLVSVALLLIDPQLTLSWLRSLSPRRCNGYITEPLIWQHLSPGGKIPIVLVTLIVYGLALLMLIDSIPKLLQSWETL